MTPRAVFRFRRVPGARGIVAGTFCSLCGEPSRAPLCEVARADTPAPHVLHFCQTCLAFARTALRHESGRPFDRAVFHADYMPPDWAPENAPDRAAAPKKDPPQ